ncbi:MAG: Crp/Fnr family transcriptional regulator [Usitatibacter sp.]
MMARSDSSVSDIAFRNGILGALAQTEYRRLVALMERVELERGDVVYQANRDIHYVYFPEDAVIAMVDTLEDGRTVEVGVIGSEGMVGINIFLGGVTTPDKAVVQLSGAAFRMASTALRKELRFGSPLQRLLLQYTQVFLAVMSQSVACSQFHRLDQRLARWILTMDDYAHPNTLTMSHEFIAQFLGVRRAGVAGAASLFRSEGLIDYRRGRITVMDRAGLERRSCECYRFIRDQHQALRDKVPQIISGSWPSAAAL